MDKKDGLNKLDKPMWEDYERTAEEIEAGLSDDGSFDPDRVDSDVLRDRIYKRIEAREEEKKKIKREKRKKWWLAERAAIFLIVTSVGIFCVSMISEANRIRLGDKIWYLTGNEVVARVGGEKGHKDIESSKEELLACQEIEEKIGIAVPRFSYEPDVKKTFSYDVFHENAMAMIQYQYGDEVLDLHMVNKERTEIAGMAFHGKKMKEVDVMGGLITIPVQKVREAQDVGSTLTAQWEYQDGYYQLSGKVDEKEFIEIVKNIYF